MHSLYTIEFTQPSIIYQLPVESLLCLAGKYPDAQLYLDHFLGEDFRENFELMGIIKYQPAAQKNAHMQKRYGDAYRHLSYEHRASFIGVRKRWIVEINKKN